MSTTTAQLSGVLRGIVAQPTGGVVGLVDGLLSVCAENGLEIDWQPQSLRYRSPGKDWQELTELKLPNSAFRAVLARIAALCNEQTPSSVSPYGGECQVRAGENHDTVCRVRISNTTSIQRLELAASMIRPSETPQ